jgi:hypothetical protein
MADRLCEVEINSVRFEASEDFWLIVTIKEWR